MRLTIRLLGLDLLDVELSTAEQEAEYDEARDLSGGELGSTSLEVGKTDRYMGFTNGLDDD